MYNGNTICIHVGGNDHQFLRTNYTDTHMYSHKDMRDCELRRIVM